MKFPKLSDFGGFLILLAIVAVALIPMPVAAQEPVSDDEVNEVAEDLYCPQCENTPLDVCPTIACEDWREEIRALLNQGKSEQEIRQYFVDRYGVQVLAEPPLQEYTTLWLLPVIAVVVGGLLLVLYLKNLQRNQGPHDDTMNVAQSSAPEPPPAATEDDYISRIEKEVREE